MFRFLILATFLTFGLSQARATGLIVPAYGNTKAQFDAILAAAAKVPTIVIINPDDGVGVKRDAFVAGYVGRLKAAKAKICGYVATGYGRKGYNSLVAQMNSYIAWYGVDSFFFDEASDQTGKVGYYANLKKYASSKGKQVIINPGTYVPAGYANVADIIISFENPYARGWSTNRPPSWGAGKSAKFGAMVYSTPNNLSIKVIERAISVGYGWVYVTDLSEPDPFWRVGGNFVQQCAYLVKRNTPPVTARQ